MTKKRICLNIGGIKFQTSESTLQRLQGSKLSMISLNAENFDKENNEYFFDRDPYLFQSVLNLYRNGTLHMPSDQCGIQMQEELNFWGIPESTISPCCWKSYNRAFNELETKMFLANESNADEDHQTRDIKKNSRFLSETTQYEMSRFKHRVWSFLMYPDSSTYSRVWHVLYLCIVMLSISVYLMDKFKTFQDVSEEKIKSDSGCGKLSSFKAESTTGVQLSRANGEVEQNGSLITKINLENLSSANQSEHQTVKLPTNGNKCKKNEPLSLLKNILMNIKPEKIHRKLKFSKPKATVLALDIFCNCVFTLEFTLRLATCPKFVDFVSFLSFADFISVVGFIISSICRFEIYNIRSICIECSHSSVNCDRPESCIENLDTFDYYVKVLTFSKYLSAFRNFRICVLGRLSNRFSLLLLATKRSRRELLMFVLIAFVLSVVFAGLIFNVNESVETLEGEKEENKFENFFKGVYWSVITMTTVGYGDIYPTNSKGKMIAICCSISGLLLLTKPVSLISANFSDLYFGMKDIQRQKLTCKRKEKIFICKMFSKCMSKSRNLSRKTRSSSVPRDVA